MKNPRVHPLFQNNKHPATDRLYSPLRQALKKRCFSKDSQIYATNMNDSQHHLRTLSSSKLSKKGYHLTSSEAEQMQKKIFIPAHRKLIPTNQLKNVQGKKYVAVDVSLQQHQPISEQQFMKKRKQNLERFQQKLYILSSTPSGFSTPKLSQEIVLENGEIERQSFFSDNSLRKNDTRQTMLRRQLQAKRERDEVYSLLSPFSKKKPKYKYNLFSALDEPTNTRCKNCIASNQIIASKPQYQPWD